MRRPLPAQHAAQSDHRHRITADWLEDDAVVAGKIDDDAVTAATLNDDVYGPAPNTIEPDDAASAGSAATVSRSDHEHGIVAAAPAGLTLTGTSAEGSATSFARSNHVHATAALPWGVVARQTLTTNNGPHTASVTTDFALSNVSVNVSRLYVVHLQCQIDFAAAGGDWTYNFHVGGTLTLQMGRVEKPGAGYQDDRHMAKLWVPSTGTVNLDIRLVENAGSATVTLNGSSTVTRDFWIEDVGPR